MTGFGFPRLLAALAAVCVLLAIAYHVFGWYGWHSSAGLLCAAAVLGFLSWDTARMTHEQRFREREQTRRLIDGYGRDEHELRRAS